MAKVGRNEPCPCGSDKKYKKCHGSIEHLDRIGRVIAEVPKLKARADAAQVQRERQQGFGRPIISMESHGYRMVAVKNRLLHSQKWKTFHDFLMDYIKMAIDPDWGNAEIAKPLEQRHPILVWYQKLCEYQRTFITEPGKVSTAPMSGAVAAFMHLAYDLYALDHNAELQEKLLARLRNHDNFPGARYEVHVAAMLIRAGFDLEFEDEDDGSTTHCEFTATNKRTGKKFSVEAKHQAANRFRLIRLLNRALAKKANHQRIVFIDINTPDDATDKSIPSFMSHALDHLRMYEERNPSAKSLPQAYVLVTNMPWHHHLEQTAQRCAVLAEGFHIPEFKQGAHFRSLRHAIDAREAHIEMHELLQSLRDHTDIPSTFDGEIPEFAFGEATQRLVDGERYMVPDENGVLSPGTLSSPVVWETEKVVVCGMNMDDGRALLCKKPMSDTELAAWRRHPDTFFGFVSQRTTRADTPLEMYDFLMCSYSMTSKENLLEFMAQAPDIAELSMLDQPKLASIYAERMATSMMATAPQKGILSAKSKPEATN